MLTYIFFVVLGYAYLNVGRYLTDKDMEDSLEKDWNWSKQLGFMLLLPLWTLGQFSANGLYKITLAPALYLRGKRAKNARLKAAEEPVDPKLLAAAEKEADRAAQGIPDSESEPEPEPEPKGSPVK